MKSFAFPSPVLCNRRFGWPCLLHYFPRRCGGMNPLTMWKDYLQQSRRLEILHQCRAIVTNSVHMVAEYARYGLMTHLTPLPVLDSPMSEVSYEKIRRPSNIRQLLFLGRLHATKGGQVLLEAAPQIAVQLQLPLRIVFAGAGPAREEWMQRAQQAQAQCPELEVRFVGQIDHQERDRLLTDSDLLVVPSLWPEPFGLTGPEAGLFGVPAAAFDAGGIADWLQDGMNGCLAPADPPTATGLAEAVVRCLRDPATYERMRCNAAEMAKRFNMETHLAALTEVFRQAVAPVPSSR